MTAVWMDAQQRALTATRDSASPRDAQGQLRGQDTMRLLAAKAHALWALADKAGRDVDYSVKMVEAEEAGERVRNGRTSEVDPGSPPTRGPSPVDHALTPPH